MDFSKLNKEDLEELHTRCPNGCEGVTTTTWVVKGRPTTTGAIPCHICGTKFKVQYNPPQSVIVEIVDEYSK